MYYWPISQRFFSCSVCGIYFLIVELLFRQKEIVLDLLYLYEYKKMIDNEKYFMIYFI